MYQKQVSKLRTFLSILFEFEQLQQAMNCLYFCANCASVIDQFMSQHFFVETTKKAIFAHKNEQLPSTRNMLFELYLPQVFYFTWLKRSETKLVWAKILIHIKRRNLKIVCCCFWSIWFGNWQLLEYCQIQMRRPVFLQNTLLLPQSTQFWRENP